MVGKSARWSDVGKQEIFVTSFPRSGNTWLNRLLCDLLGSPLKNTPDMTPVWFGPRVDGEHVVRKVHRVGADKLDRGKWVLIQRDPRDVAVSIMYYRGGTSLWSFIAWMACRCGGKDPTAGIYEGWLRPWLDHPDVLKDPAMGIYEAWLRSWLDHPDMPDVVTRYELLHTDPINELHRVVYALTGISLEEAWTRECYERQGFEKVRTAAGGVLDHPMRKGIVGDWRNHFTNAEGCFFHDSLGDFMQEQGYIVDPSWWKTLPRTSNHCTCHKAAE